MTLPFLAIHLGCLAVFLPDVHATATALALCFGLYALRVFGVTCAYHRYFSHRSFKTSRGFQFVLAWLGCSALQKGPLWWAGHHRHHHRYSDQEDDVHSPIKESFWWAHIGWVLSEDYLHTDWEGMHDFASYPDLRWLDQWHWVPGLTLAVLCYLVGGLSGFVWGFLVSTVLVYHATFCINSLCHLWGRTRYKTTDESKNSLILALITFGEGWHNNHHYYQSSANQGFFWWEIDITYYVIRLFGILGLVWDIRTPPESKRRVPPPDAVAEGQGFLALPMAGAQALASAAACAASAAAEPVAAAVKAAAAAAEPMAVTAAVAVVAAAPVVATVASDPSVVSSS